MRAVRGLGWDGRFGPYSSNSRRAVFPNRNPRTGHTGFTGTSLLMGLESGKPKSYVNLFSPNRVHPDGKG